MARAKVLCTAALALCTSCLFLSGCTFKSEAAEKSFEPATVKSVTSGTEFKPVCSTAEYNDKKASSKANAHIDISSVSKGYVAAKASSKKTLKFQVEREGVKYNYDLSNTGEPGIFPLNIGDGIYRFSIYQNISEDRYVLLHELSANVRMANDVEPFLRPNDMCWFTKDSDSSRKALELTKDAENQGDALAAIYNYVVNNIEYDTAKAENLSTQRGYTPSPDAILSSGKGICIDYASLTAAMLRSVGIPCKIVTGYVTDEGLYHAWNMVYLDGTWQNVAIQVSEKTWTRLDTTCAANASVLGFLDDASYRDRYVY